MVKIATFCLSLFVCRLVPSRHLFIRFRIELEYGKAINAHKTFWEGGRKSDALRNFLPSSP